MSAPEHPHQAAYLQQRLDERGWQQNQLAERLGYTDAHTSRLVTGRRRLTRDGCARVAQVFGVPVADVYTAAGYELPSTEPRAPTTVDVIESDPRLTRAQRDILVGIYKSWVG